jgi:hypothetical protein
MGLNKTPIMNEDDLVVHLKAWEELCHCYEDYIHFLETGYNSYLEKRRLKFKIDAARKIVDKY